MTSHPFQAADLGIGSWTQGAPATDGAWHEASSGGDNFFKLPWPHREPESQHEKSFFCILVRPETNSQSTSFHSHGFLTVYHRFKGHHFNLLPQTSSRGLEGRSFFGLWGVEKSWRFAYELYVLPCDSVLSSIFIHFHFDPFGTAPFFTRSILGILRHMDRKKSFGAFGGGNLSRGFFGDWTLRAGRVLIEVRDISGIQIMYWSGKVCSMLPLEFFLSLSHIS